MTPDRVDEAMTLWPWGGPYDPESTVDAARTIAELVRYLNHATPPWKTADCLQYPSHLGSVIANLRAALAGMEQLSRQLAKHAERFADDPALYDDGGHNPIDTVATVSIELDRVRALVAHTADALGRAHEAVDRLGIREGDLNA